MDIDKIIRLIIMILSMILIGLTVVLGYAVSKGIITNYPMVAILLSIGYGVIIVGGAGYAMFKRNFDFLKSRGPSWGIIIYWIVLAIGCFSLWKWFSFSPHTFKDIQYLLVAVTFIGLAGCRLIFYYLLGK